MDKPKLNTIPEDADISTILAIASTNQKRLEKWGEALETENEKLNLAIIFNGMFTHADDLKQIQTLEAENEGLKSLLQIAQCPNCDGSGSYTVTGTEVLQDENGEPYQSPIPEQEQCQWCDERKQFLNPKK